MNVSLFLAVAGAALGLVLMAAAAEWRIWRERRRLKAVLARLPAGADVLGRVRDWRGRELLAYRAGGTLHALCCKRGRMPAADEEATLRWMEAEALLPSPPLTPPPDEGNKDERPSWHLPLENA